MVKLSQHYLILAPNCQLSHYPAKWSFCKRWGHTRKQCWDKYASIRPNHFWNRGNDNKKRILIANTKAEASTIQEDELCLIARNISSSGCYFIQFNESKLSTCPLMWLIDFQVSFHMAPELASFLQLEYTEPFPLEMSDKSEVKADR